MKNLSLKPPTLPLRQVICTLLAMLFLGGHLGAQTVATISGLKAGNVNGNTLSTALFNRPTGLAIDPSGAYMVVTDYSNNVVRLVSNLGNIATSVTSLLTSNSVNRPIAVAIDSATNIYVLNRGNGTNNGSLQHFNGLYLSSSLVLVYPPLATNIVNATSLALDGFGYVYFTMNSNTVVRINPATSGSNVVGIITNTKTSLQGIAVLDNGTLALSDAGNHGIWLMNPYGNITNNTVPLTGFHGAADTNGPPQFAALNSPKAISKAGGNKLVIADYGNHKYKLVDLSSGTISLFYGVTSNLWIGNQALSGLFPGWRDGSSGPASGSAESRFPYGVVVATNGEVYTSEVYYHLLRHVTATGLTGPVPGYPPLYYNPAGLALDVSGTFLYLADQGNNAIQRLNLANNQTTRYLNSSNGISSPASVLLDTNNNLYVLNGGANASIISFDPYQNFLGTNAVGFTNPTAFTMDLNGNIFVAELGGAVKVVFPSGAVNTIGTITNAGAQLQGIALFDDGSIAVSDAGNHVIWSINSITKAVSRLTGTIGVSGNTFSSSSNTAKLFLPHQMVRDTGNRIIVADTGNNRLITVTRSGAITNSLNPTNATIWFGNPNDPVANSSTRFVSMISPVGLAVGANGTVYTSETFYSDIRGLLTTGQTPPNSTPNVILPYFVTPAGIAFDPLGNAIFVADSANSTIDLLNLNNNLTTTFLSTLDGVSHPASVLVDTNENIYVLNQNGGSNGDVSIYDIYGNYLGLGASGLTQPTAFLLDGYGKLFITEQTGKVRVFSSDGTSNVVATVTNANVSLQGISVFDDGTIAVSDAGNQVVWAINPITKFISKLTGQLGTNGSTLGASNFAKLYQPHQLTRGANNKLVISDYANNRLVTVTRSGSITNVLNSTNASVWFGQTGDPVATATPKFVPMVQPSGVTVANNGVVYASETYYDDIRGLTGSNVGVPTATPGIPLPVYSAPAGIALNQLANALFIADPTNNTVSILNLINNQTAVFLDGSSGIVRPVDVALDNSDNIYVLNQGTGGNGSILKFDKFGNLVGTNASNLSLPTAMKLSIFGDLYVAELGGLVQKFPLAGGSNTVVNINTNVSVQLQGVALLDNGSVIVSDTGNHVIWKIAPGATNAVILAGVLGTPGNTLGASGTGKLNKPIRLAQAKGGLFIIADSGNNRVVLADNLGTISSVLNSSNATLWFGLPVDPILTNSPLYVPMLAPVALAIGNAGTVFVSENTYKDVRGLLSTGLLPPVTPPAAPLNLVAVATYGQISLTWSAAIGATNYFVKRSSSTGGPYTSVGTTTNNSYVDTTVLNGTTYFYVVSGSNSGGDGPNSAEASATPPIPPPIAPRIGWFDYEGNNFNGFFTKLYPVTIATFNNDTLIAIDPGTNGVSTYFISGSPPLNGNPSFTNGNGSPFYQDNLSFAQPLPFTISPDVIIKAINVDSIGQSSPVTTAEFKFQVGNPIIVGNNGAQFTVTDITTNAVFWYTLDGSDPSNGPPSIGPIAMDTNTTTATLSFNVTSNLLFRVRAFKDGYTPSGLAVQNFSTATFNPNTISFGFASGEASSDFIAAPGQIFYAPVTLTMLPNTTVYSLQFNLTVTNGGPNPGPPVTANAYNFNSFLEEPIPNTTPPIYEVIPPLSFYPYFLINPPPVNQIVQFNGPLGVTNFVSFLTTNTSANLISVGWLERLGQKNLYDTTKQTLLTYSEAHDVTFPNAANPGLVEVGGFSFQIPISATNGQTYQIQIGRPSATKDGIGAPGSDVFIAAPTNINYYSGAPINAIKYVTVGQRKYIAGSVYPFRWFNAGDFGSSNIVNADVAQVFQAAIYSMDVPPAGSDFFDAMDSCGSYLAYLDSNTGYYTNDLASVGHANPLFDGNDVTINQLAYGDGVLDICDIYVTFRRSLDPTLTWFRRYWSNGQLVADTSTPNIAAHVVLKTPAVQPKVQTISTNPPAQVNFTAGDVIGTGGQIVQVPIKATIIGDYRLRVLALNLTVTPLDGSPALTTQVSFTQTATTLGQPYSTSSSSRGNFAAAWLNSTNAGLTGTVTIGTLNITIPVGATNAAYAIHFDHASGSPNGLASFPKQLFTGIVTTSARTNSYYTDGIPDSWRLRWFGTIYNSLSQSNANASGDGIKNWNKFIAGIDPTQPNNFPKVNAKSSTPSGYTAAIHWPSVQGKKYAIERASVLFGGSWSVLTTNTGTGGDVEYDDTYTNKVKFYRVRILP